MKVTFLSDGSVPQVAEKAFAKKFVELATALHEVLSDLSFSILDTHISFLSSTETPTTKHLSEVLSAVSVNTTKITKIHSAAVRFQVDLQSMVPVSDTTLLQNILLQVNNLNAQGPVLNTCYQNIKLLASNTPQAGYAVDAAKTLVNGAVATYEELCKILAKAQFPDRPFQCDLTVPIITL